jgi:hypothetical protein
MRDGTTKRAARSARVLQEWTALAVVVAAGCHAGSVCHPPGSTQGQFVNTQNSAAYRSRVAAQNGADTPHMGCKAEANIPVTLQVMVDDSVGGAGKGPLDPRLQSSANNRDQARGEYRVLGVGRGIDREDCGSTAMQACNDAIDAYFKQQHGDRPIGVVCRLSENQESCQR